MIVMLEYPDIDTRVEFYPDIRYFNGTEGKELNTVQFTTSYGKQVSMNNFKEPTVRLMTDTGKVLRTFN